MGRGVGERKREREFYTYVVLNTCVCYFHGKTQGMVLLKSNFFPQMALWAQIYVSVKFANVVPDWVTVKTFPSLYPMLNSCNDFKKIKKKKRKKVKKGSVDYLKKSLPLSCKQKPIFDLFFNDVFP